MNRRTYGHDLAGVPMLLLLGALGSMALAVLLSWTLSLSFRRPPAVTSSPPGAELLDRILLLDHATVESAE
jgi:hypothetical protein